MSPKPEVDEAEPEVKKEEQEGQQEGREGSEQSTKAASKPLAKRRTKTGCLSESIPPCPSVRGGVVLTPEQHAEKEESNAAKRSL